MTDPRQARIESLFEHACDLSIEDRHSFLARETGSDEALFREVESLLQHHDAANEKFLEGGSPAGPPESASETLGALDIPRQFGRYTVKRRIGIGGMGAVYEAEQDNPRRNVALKVVRIGLGRPDAGRRFRREVQLLGALQHPAITCIYDAGSVETAAGKQPFFAMELVDGKPIDEWSRSGSRSIEERVAMVARICDAVQHAHEHGVVHRDLKPGNILIDKDGQPKILDFGIARAIAPDVHTVTLQTEVGQLVGTVPYMSPEQVRGDTSRVGIASDIYALGVLLFELLANRLPLDVRNHSIPEAVRIISEEEPSRLSTIDSRFRGDLTTIVSKALEKSPDRRYRSAAELAADLRHYLHQEPIQARPASTIYQLRKFAQRNKKLVTAVAIAFVALTAATIMTSVSAVRQAHLRGIADSQTVLAKRAAYRAQLLGAQAALRNDDFIGARRILDSVDASDRSAWEWRHLYGRLDSSDRLLDVAGGVVRCVTFSPDGKFLLTASADGVARIWDVATGRVAHELRGHKGQVNQAAFTHDGANVISSGKDDTIRVWDAATGRSRRVIEFDRSVAISKDQEQRNMGVMERGQIVGFDVSPDDRYITALLASLHLVTWELKTGRCVRTARLACNPQTHGFVRYLPAKNTLEIAVGWYTGLLICNPDFAAIIEGDKTTHRMSQSDFELSCVDVNPATNRVVTGSPDKTITLWNASPLEPQSPWRGHTAAVNAVAFDPSGNWVASGSSDQTVRLWDVASGRTHTVFAGSTDVVTSLAFSPDGVWLAAASRDGSVRIWNVASMLKADSRSRDRQASITGRIYRGHNNYVYAAKFDPADSAGRRVASISWGGELQLWDAFNGKLMKSIDPEMAAPQCMAYGASGRWIAVGGNSPFIPLINVTTGAIVRRFEVAPGDAHAVAISRDESLVAATENSHAAPFEKKSAFVWDLATGRLRWQAAGPAWYMTADSPAGLRIAAFAPTGSHMIDAKTGQELFKFNGVEGRVYSLDFSPSGDRFIAGFQDGTAHVWNAETGAELAILRGHTERVYDAIFSPDMTRIATSSNDNTIRIWDATKYEPLLELQGHEQYVYGLAFSLDGTMLLSTSGDGSVRIWDSVPQRQRR